MPEYLTLVEAAAHCRESPRTFRRRVERGEVPYHRLPKSRRLLFRQVDIDSLIASTRFEPSARRPIGETRRTHRIPAMGRPIGETTKTSAPRNIREGPS